MGWPSVRLGEILVERKERVGTIEFHAGEFAKPCKRDASPDQPSVPCSHGMDREHIVLVLDISQEFLDDVFESNHSGHIAERIGY